DRARAPPPPLASQPTRPDQAQPPQQKGRRSQQVQEEDRAVNPSLQAAANRRTQRSLAPAPEMSTRIVSSICNFSATICSAPRSFAPGHVALATCPRSFEDAVLGDEAAGDAPLVVFHAPGEQLLAIGQHQRQVVRVFCEIAELPRILLEIKEQRC